MLSVVTTRNALFFCFYRDGVRVIHCFNSLFICLLRISPMRYLSVFSLLSKFRKLLPLRRCRSCAGPKTMSQPFKKICRTFFELKNMSNIFCGPAQDRPLRSADLAGSNCQHAELELGFYQFEPMLFH